MLKTRCALVQSIVLRNQCSVIILPLVTYKVMYTVQCTRDGDRGSSVALYVYAYAYVNVRVRGCGEGVSSHSEVRVC